MIPTEIWVLPRPRPDCYVGSFPLHFEQKLWKLMGRPEKVLHPFGGLSEIGDSVDLNATTTPTWVGDAHDLHWIADETYDFVILDPPYSDEEARTLYGTTKKLRPAQYTREAVRVCKPGGWVVVYTDREPNRPPRCNHTMRIVVVLRPSHRPRIAGVFQKRKPGMPFFGTEPGELELVAA